MNLNEAITNYRTIAAQLTAQELLEVEGIRAARAIGFVQAGYGVLDARIESFRFAEDFASELILSREV